MMPTLMEIAALLVASAVLYHAARSLLSGFRHRNMILREVKRVELQVATLALRQQTGDASP